MQCLLCSRHCAKRSTSINSFSPQDSSIKEELLLPSFYRCKKGDPERLGNWANVTYVGSSIEVQVVWSRVRAMND